MSKLKDKGIYEPRNEIINNQANGANEQSNEQMKVQLNNERENRTTSE